MSGDIGEYTGDWLVGLNLNFEFETAHKFFMNLNFVSSKLINFNLNLNLIFLKSMNLNFKIRKK